MGAPEIVGGEAGLLRFITAGSVDDGKSTLIGRLLHDTQAILSDQLASIRAASRRRGLETMDLSLLTDGLDAEREQGITIDVAYRYFSTPRRKFIIGDAPGHVQYTRNMVTAASTADVAVLLVDVRKGVLAQTRRHAYLARWLGIERVVLAINKMDLLDYSRERFEAHRGAFLRFAEPLDFEDVTTIPVSALVGDMIVERGERLPWYVGPTLIEYLESAPALSRRLRGGFRFPVQRVARVPAAGAARPAIPVTLPERGYQGTVAAGGVRVGDALMILPSGATTRLLGIGSADGERTSAHADEAVTLFLADQLDIARGDLIVSPERPARVLERVTAELCWLVPEPYAPNRMYVMKHTTRTVRVATIELERRIDVDTFVETPQPDALRMNEIAGVAIRLQQPICADPYRENRATGSFILIDAATNDTVAAGVIREPKLSQE